MSSPRLFVPGFSHHVRHRGNNCCNVFIDDSDRETFLSMMGKSAQAFNVALHCYALMHTHYHAQVTARDAEALPRMMQSLGAAYVKYFNRRYRRTGTLWEGRYRASLILDERHWYNCLRYIEANPVRARMVTSAGEYKWSSYRCNALGFPDPLVSPHALYLQLGATAADRAAKWAVLCDQALTERDLGRIRAAIQRNQTMSSEEPRTDPIGSLRLHVHTSGIRAAEPAG